MSKHSTIAIITARGGSKRIPKKSIKLFVGKPIIQYSIEAALHANCFDEVMVSTDDEEIALIAKKNGASVPFMRSNKASNDYSTTTDALEEVLNEYIKIGKSFTYCCCIYPTAPFITPQKLQAAFKKISTTTAHSVIPIVRFGFPILRSLKIEEGLLKMNWPEYMNVRSQDLQLAFHDAGQFYFFSVKEFLTNKKIFTENTIGIEMPESEVQDIDTLEDWKIAELKYAIMKSLL